MKESPEFKKFTLPEEILTQLYELTGGSKAYKGFIMAYCNEDGTPVIHTACESQITEAGLLKCLEDFILKYGEVDQGIEENL